MGAALGIALLAAEPWVRCAAIGLMHNRYYDQILADAARIRCPVLFLMQWDDDRVPRAEAFDLFDTIASPDKRLHAHPGGHGQMPQEAITASERFLAAHLAPVSAP
jgi:dienelactone hydrolase